MKEFVRVCGASSGRFEVASSEFVVEFVASVSSFSRVVLCLGLSRSRP